MSTILIEKIAEKETPLPVGAERDEVVMGWEERRRSRQRVQTAAGRELAVALPTGSVLDDGDVLYMGEGFYVVVEAAHEDVLVVPLDEVTSAAALGYELGNRHLPVSIDHGMLMTPYDRLIEEMLEHLGVPYERRREPFDPVRVVHHHG